MKILRAEKFKPKKRSKSSNTQSETILRKTDWEVLVQTDRSTGKLNLRSEAALKDPGSVKRLLEAGMIDAHGKLTAEGKKKCAGLIENLMKPEAESAAAPESTKAAQSGEAKDGQSENLTASDWAVLMKYDRKTGNLLTYDPVTNEMDQTSRAILSDPAIIQRLIDNNMILPGGWLTPEAKEECRRIEEKLKNQPAESLPGPEDHPDPNLDSESQSNRKPLSMEEQKNSLNQNPALLSKGEHKSKDTLEAKMDTDSGPERLPDKLTKINNKKKDLSESKKSAGPKTYAADDRKVFTSYAIHQHYPDPQDEPEAKANAKPVDSPLQTLKSLDEKDKHEDLQAFFEQLPIDHAAPKQDPERNSNGDLSSKNEHMSKEKQIPEKTHAYGTVRDPSANGHGDQLPKGKQQIIFSPEPRQKKEKFRQVSQPVETTLKETSSIRKLRKVDLDNLPKSGDDYEEIPKRKKKGPGGSGGDSTAPPRFSLRDVFHIIFKHKLQIFICFFFIVFMATIATLLMNPVYEASTGILVKLGRESVFVPTSGNVTPILNINREQQVNSEIEILKSRSLAEKVVEAIGPAFLYKSLGKEKAGILSSILLKKREEISPDERKAANFESAVARFMNALTVSGVKKSNVIQVSFKHSNPLMAAKVVNELSNLYLSHHLAVHKTPQNVKFFKEQTHLLKTKIERAEESLKAIRKKHNITSLEEQRSLLLAQSSELNSSLNQTISMEVETEKRIRLIRKQLASVPETISQGEETDQNPYLINTLEARLVELQLKEKALLTKYTDESRLVQNVKEEIRVVEQKLEEQSTKSYGRKTSGVNPTHQRLKEELFRNEAELEALKAKKMTQTEHIVELQTDLDNLNQVELELKQLEQDIEVDRGNYRLYLSKVEESRISDAMDSEKIASVSLIGPARPPRKPVSPKIMLNLLIGIFLGAFGSLSLALFREYLDDRIEKIEDVETELQLPVLASIPIFEQKAVKVN